MKDCLKIRGILFSLSDIEELCKRECALCSEKYKSYYINNEKRVIEIETENDSLFINFNDVCCNFIKANMQFSRDLMLYFDSENSVFYADLFKIAEKLSDDTLVEFRVSKNNVLFIYSSSQKRVSLSDLPKFLA